MACLPKKLSEDALWPKKCSLIKIVLPKPNCAKKVPSTIWKGLTSTQIYRIANLKVPLLYLVALSELKLNENSEHDEVVMYRHQDMYQICSCLNPFISGGIFSTHLSPIFCVKKIGKLREIPSVSFFRIKISIKLFINKRVFCNLI